jgi:3-hydroxyacyl-CoA dehydrogenase
VTCVMCNRTHDVMWTIEVIIGRRTEQRAVCNTCELAHRIERSKR